MLEVDAERPEKVVLHVYPYSNGTNVRTTEHYPYDLKRVKKRSLSFKVNIKNIEKKLPTVHKFPRTRREHTEFSRYPRTTTCPNCLSYIKTKVYHYNTSITHAIAASLIPIGMCLFPYTIDKYKNTAHYCPRCNIYLGTKYGSGRKLLSRCAAAYKSK